MNHAVIAMNEAKAKRGIKAGATNTITPDVLARASEYVHGGWAKDGSVIPTVEGLAKHLNIHRSTVYESKELSDTLEQVQREQSIALINRGLTNEYNPAIVKLLLSSKHGYIERTEVLNNHSIVAEPQQAIASDFSAYVKSKTQAVEGEIVTPMLPDKPFDTTT